jgi:lipid A 3-O-deacylase
MKHIFAILLLLFSMYVSAQRDSIKDQDVEKYFRLNYDNDFFTGTDRYYTQGIVMDLSIPVLRKNPMNKLMLKLKEAGNYYGVRLEQDGFTPRSIRHDSIYFGERPYASVLFISFYRISVNAVKRQSVLSEIDLGTIGPNGKGEEEQKAIHKSLNNIQPLGWEYQIQNDVIINYNFEYVKGLVESKYFECMLISGLRAGTLYDDLGAGLQFRLGVMQPYFENSGLTRNRKAGKLQCYIYAKEITRGVAYNATLQGGVFNKSSLYTIPEKDINRLTASAYIGIRIFYKTVGLEYEEAYVTREFKKGLYHGWGHCGVIICF